MEVQSPNMSLCTNAHIHLRAVALAAEVRMRGPDGLSGRAAIDLRTGGAIGYGWTVIVCENIHI